MGKSEKGARSEGGYLPAPRPGAGRGGEVTFYPPTPRRITHSLASEPSARIWRYHKDFNFNTTKITNHYMITRTTIANKLQCFGKGLRTIRASIGSGEKGEGRTTRACRQGPTVWYRDGDNLGQQQFGATTGKNRAAWARHRNTPPGGRITHAAC